MVAASRLWATALKQLTELPTTPERTSPSAQVVVPGPEVLPLPALVLLQALPSSSPAEWNRVVADLKVSEQCTILVV